MNLVNNIAIPLKWGGESSFVEDNSMFTRVVMTDFFSNDALNKVLHFLKHFSSIQISYSTFRYSCGQ